MADKQTLPDNVLKNISNQIGDLLPGLIQQLSTPPKTVELRESFAVWTLDLFVQKTEMRSNSQFPARETGGWHHQILFDGAAAAHAESIMLDSGELRVGEVSISPLAKKVDEAIDWAESLHGSMTVRLLELPSLLIYTFWLVESQQIYIIDSFPTFVDLKPGSLLSERDFESFLFSNLQSLEPSEKTYD
jgi:hypothetical protein